MYLLLNCISYKIKSVKYIILHVFIRMLRKGSASRACDKSRYVQFRSQGAQSEITHVEIPQAIR